MIYEARKYKQIALLGTIFFVTGVVIILLYFGFTTPLPLPEEEGILINFGYNNNGKGNIETSKAYVVNKKKQEEKIKSIPNESKKSKEDLLTQDFEDAAAIKARKEKEKKRKEHEKELEKKRIEEKKKQELIEKQKKLDAERQKIDQNTKNAFASGKISNSNSSSDGTGSGKGNQGNLSGDPTSKNYSQGHGLGNKGIGFSLKGRTPNGGKLPKPTYSSNEEGVVVIQVTVTQDGVVTSAIYKAKGSTTTSQKLIKSAINAAYKAKFNVDNNAEQFQVGTITYRFSLQ